ncbi:hypothetical protein EVAR_12984_1 [Eumeta japonica]|uniref:Reverse transcriptase domain-containing protein n=1 Tax=Eumeta variegata TaxID=151549 RepID=A0A4C1TWU0_EUMVA|nr:hypothetical protein EVAR_12984_1 [Eumeta japonica]
MDQIFSLRNIAEKVLASGQKVFCISVDLEKAYDRVKRNDQWRNPSMNGVSSGLVQVLVFQRGENMTECNTLIEGEKVKQVKEFVYLGNLFNDGKHDRDIERRVNTGNKVNGALLAIMNIKSVLR